MSGVTFEVPSDNSYLYITNDGSNDITVTREVYSKDGTYYLLISVIDNNNSSNNKYYLYRGDYLDIGDKKD